MALLEHKRFSNIFIDPKTRGIFTKNLVPGQDVYGEKIIKHKGEEYRNWDPKRSKLGAAIKKDINQLGLKTSSVVLYLGSSSGTTVSHLSDMIANNKGIIYALDFAPKVTRELIFVAEKRKNIIPLLADANKPETFANKISKADLVFMDVAQKNQTEIFTKNCNTFLRKNGFGVLALKARSIDVAKKPSIIFREVKAELEKSFTIVDYKTLDPYEKDHAIYVIKKK
jgi:fibrillarin-like pre-rRNA processing protein